jgi:DNA-binding CsgD family transcriptional regulator
MKNTKRKSNMEREVARLEQGEAWVESDEVVSLKVRVPLDKVVPVRLSTDHWQRLRKQAAEFGIGPSTLCRMWILERLGGKTFTPVFPAASWLRHTSGFTVRERDVFNLVSQDFPVSEIAKNLHTSETAVRKYLSSILRKLNEDSEYATGRSSE